MTRSVREANTAHDNQVTKRWTASMRHQRDAQVHDLQFELATQKVRSLKIRHDNEKHSQEQTFGIDEFERNLRRNGLGGNDEAQSNTEKFTVTYEDAELYWERLEETLDKNDANAGSDVRDFLSQLKERTKDKRTARYEKARRKRRMLVDQANLAASSQMLSVTGSQSGKLDYDRAEQEEAETLRFLEQEREDEERRIKALELQATIDQEGHTAVETFLANFAAGFDNDARELQRKEILRKRDVSIRI
jgi:hypothetical protein